MARNSKLTIIVPCFNEAQAIPKFISDAEMFSKLFDSHFPNFKLNILFVDNNSTDSSNAILKDYVDRVPELFSLTHCAIPGYGAALRHGFLNSAHDSQYLGFIDLDDTYPIEEFISMFEKIISEHLDMIYGIRLHGSSNIEILRYLGNFFYVKLLSILTDSNLKDACSGMRLFKSEKMGDVINLKRNDLSFSIEFTVFAVVCKWKLGQHPIAYRSRIGSSKLNIFYDGFIFLYILLITVLKLKKIK
jgi:glycosyltransferase involved in cell wall biosynthesis